MIRFFVLLLAVLVVGAIFAPALREGLAWALAFLSLLILGDLLRSSFGKFRQAGSRSPSRRT